MNECVLSTVSKDCQASRLKYSKSCAEATGLVSVDSCDLSVSLGVHTHTGF